jgi:hypothetical protein
VTKPILLINEVDRVVTTIFEDGATLHAAPNTDTESIARARALGYRIHQMDPKGWADSVWRMTKDHERLHHLVAEAQGRDHSAALWIAAHPDYLPTLNAPSAALARAEADREERIVLLIQRLLNQGLDDVPVS